MSLLLLLLWQQSPEPTLPGEWGHWLCCVLPTGVGRCWNPDCVDTGGFAFSHLRLGVILLCSPLPNSITLNFYGCRGVCVGHGLPIHEGLETANSMTFLTVVLPWMNHLLSPFVSLGIPFDASQLSQMAADLSNQWLFLCAGKYRFFYDSFWGIMLSLLILVCCPNPWAVSKGHGVRAALACCRLGHTKQQSASS